MTDSKIEKYLQKIADLKTGIGGENEDPKTVEARRLFVEGWCNFPIQDNDVDDFEHLYACFEIYNEYMRKKK